MKALWARRRGAKAAHQHERKRLLDFEDDSEDEDDKLDSKGERKGTSTVIFVEGRLQELSLRPPVRLGVLNLFRYRSRRDELQMLLALVLSICSGLMAPLPAFLFGQLVQQLSRPSTIPSKPTAYQVRSWFARVLRAFDIGDADLFLRWSTEAAAFAPFFVAGALLALATGYAVVGMWTRISDVQLHRLRVAYLRAMLRKDVAWIDGNGPAALSAQLSYDCSMMRAGMCEKVGFMIHYTCVFCICICLATRASKYLMLSLLVISPLLAFAGYHLTKVMGELGRRMQAAYAAAGAVVEQALRCVRAVAAYGGEPAECARYAALLADVERLGVRHGVSMGFGLGITALATFATYALAFYVGSHLLAADRSYAHKHYGELGCSHPAASCVRGSDVCVGLLCMLMGSFALGTAWPNGQAIAFARGYALKVFDVIGSASRIDPVADVGAMLPKVRGALSLRGVHFAYPSRRDALVLRGLTLEVDAGRTVALVGPSGAGKSTVVALLERFYDPLVGEVLLDGTPLRALNVRWLRRQLGLVMQEPVLFDGTVGENIAYGVAEGASHHRVEAAARVAHAHDFIASLPHGYATQVGHAGSALSGGQKQRVAIARALLREPRVLIFDEATSALDGESERAVQRALDGLMAERRCTLLLIAHRLSTVRHADTIAVLVRGRLAESGTHEELVARPDGHYRAMVAGADGDAAPR